MKLKCTFQLLAAAALAGGALGAHAGDGLELPPPPAAGDFVLPEVDAAAQKPAPKQLASAVRANSIDLNDAEQIWPARGAQGDADTDGATPLGAIPALPQGVEPNPNLPASANDAPPPPPAATAKSAPAAAASGAALSPMLAALKQENTGRSTLETALYDQLRAAMPSGSTGYIFDKATMPAQVKLPRGQASVRYDFRLPQRGIGPVPFTGTVLDANGQPFSRFSGSAWIDREATGLQVTRVVAKGDVISESDVQPLGTRLSQLPRGAVEEAARLVGSAAKQEVRPGMWLTDQMFAASNMVKRGAQVTIRLSHGPLEIAVPGAAKQDGAQGQVIKVENAQSHREVFARVISKDEVQVVF